MISDPALKLLWVSLLVMAPLVGEIRDLVFKSEKRGECDGESRECSFFPAVIRWNDQDQLRQLDDIFQMLLECGARDYLSFDRGECYSGRR